MMMMSSDYEIIPDLKRWW